LRFLISIITTLAMTTPTYSSAQTPETGPRFSDVTADAGIRFTHNNGAFGSRYLPETMGTGCAFIDYNNDGWPDIFLINGLNWPERGGPPSTPRLYRNDRDGTFTDVTSSSGLDIAIYGMGAAVGDYDNDGNMDLFVTAVGPNHLFRNRGDGTFTNVTAAAKLGAASEFSTGAAWLDYDRDGLLDLLVANYVDWTVEADIFCTIDGNAKSYCTPESYEGVPPRLWRNLGGGTFEDATERSGLLDPSSKALGVAVLDHNQDDWPDLIIVNDTEPNRLWVNNGKGSFTERGMLAGLAFSEDGLARAGMGIDAADYDRSGYPSVVIGNFSNEMLGLYHNEGNGLFVDEAPRSDVGRRSLLTLGFACFFFDYDLDGWLDIFVTNGHIEEAFERIQTRIKYAQPPHLFRNLEGKGFREVTGTLGDELAAPRVGRGAAYADIDNDGDLDLLLTTNGGPAGLFRNDQDQHNSLRVRLEGTRTNSAGIGAVVEIRTGGETQWQMVRSGSSYLSASELVLTFGIGNRTSVDRLVVRWPGGRSEELAGVPAGQTVTIREGDGIVASEAYEDNR
jgi:hypothetical protein